MNAPRENPIATAFQNLRHMALATSAAVILAACAGGGLAPVPEIRIPGRGRI